MLYITHMHMRKQYTEEIRQIQIQHTGGNKRILNNIMSHIWGYQ